MVTNRLATATNGHLELWHSSRWILRPEGWEDSGIPEPEESAVKLHTFASRMSITLFLKAWQQIAAERHGGGELMILDRDGRGVAGPYPVLAVRLPQAI